MTADEKRAESWGLVNDMVWGDLHSMKGRADAAGGHLEERDHRRIHRYATVLSALDRRAQGVAAHGEGCQCEQCVAQIATVERAITDRLRRRAERAVLDS